MCLLTAGARILPYTYGVKYLPPNPKQFFKLKRIVCSAFWKANILKVELSMITIGELSRKLWSLRSCFLILPPGALTPQGVEGATKRDVSKHWCTLQWCASRGWVICTWELNSMHYKHVMPTETIFLMNLTCKIIMHLTLFGVNRLFTNGWAKKKDELLNSCYSMMTLWHAKAVFASQALWELPFDMLLQSYTRQHYVRLTTREHFAPQKYMVGSLPCLTKAQGFLVPWWRHQMERFSA